MKKDKFKHEVINEVEKVLLDRVRNNVCKSEADYLAGAMVVMAMINREYFGSTYDNSMDICPPLWTIYPMSGRSVSQSLKDKGWS